MGERQQVIQIDRQGKYDYFLTMVQYMIDGMYEYMAIEANGHHFPINKDKWNNRLENRRIVFDRNRDNYKCKWVIVPVWISLYVSQHFVAGLVVLDVEQTFVPNID